MKPHNQENNRLPVQWDDCLSLQDGAGLLTRQAQDVQTALDALQAPSLPGHCPERSQARAQVDQALATLAGTAALMRKEFRP